MIKRTNPRDIITDIIAMKGALQNGCISVHCTPVDLSELIEKNINWWSEHHAGEDIDSSLRGILNACPVYTDLDPTDCNSYVLVGVSSAVATEWSFANYYKADVEKKDVVSDDVEFVLTENPPNVEFTVTNKLRDCLISAIGELDASSILDKNNSPGDILDSLDQVEVIMAIERAYNIEIPDYVAKKFKTVSDVVNYIKHKGCEV
jgi:acyl carrier protein